MKQKLFTFFLALIASVSAIYASDTKVDGIWYDFNESNKTATVTYQGDDPYWYYNEYSGSVVIPSSVTYNGTTYSVTSIGDYAFEDCSSLTSVTIPNSVTSIGNSAFCYCSSLRRVTIPDSVTSIGNSAFFGCSSLTSPVYNAHCFAYMPTSYSGAYTIPEGIKQIAGGAFYNCSSLTSITIGNSVTSIGNYAFYNCSSLTSVTIGESVTSIGYEAFYNCSSLTSITIPNSVTSIGVGAFSGCTSLTSVTIGESVTSIGGSAFYNCSSLTSITIPNSVTSIGNAAFYGCSSLTSPVYNAHCFAYMPTSYSGAYTIPEGIKQIAGGAFKYCSSLTSITIPNSVKSIGYAAFRDCSSLTSVTIGESVTSIGDEAFRGCSSLTSITCEATTPPTIDDTYTFGDTYTFDGVSKSIPVYVPCGCVETYKAASDWSDFTNIQEPLAEYSIEVYVNDTIMGTAKVNYNTFCEGAQISATPNFGYHFVQWSDGNTENPRTLELTQDTILIAEFAQSFSGQCGDSLYWELVDTTLHITGKGEMYNYKSNTIPWKLLVSSIKSLSLSERTTSIGDDAFYECSSLTSVTIPNSVTSIGTYAFYDCSSLTSVTIGESVTSIGSSAFYNCSSLTSVTIPNSITSIGDAAFSSCNNITSVTWNAKNCNTYNFGSQVTSFEFGNEVEVVPSSLCEGMEKLTSVTIPNSVKTIGTSAFEGCARLGKINLGTGLEEIAANAFAGCTRLYDIYVYATYPPFAEKSSFANYNVYVYIPCEYQRDYILDVVWGEFKFIECIESEDVTTDGVLITPSTNDVTITWPTEGNADTYTIVIKKGDTVFCTLTFNADGQLLNIAFAPGRDGNNRPAQYAEQAGNGYRFTVTGLTEATQYAYNITTKDAANKTIATYSGEFTTMGDTTTDMDNIQSPMTNCQKILRNGQLLILRDGVEYTVMGQEL